MALDERAREISLQLSAFSPQPLKIARLGEAFISGVRSGQIASVEGLLKSASPALLSLELFGLALFRLDLRLEDLHEAGLLAPYDLQVEPEVALLELGVITPLPSGQSNDQQNDQSNASPSGQPSEERAHLTRRFGSSLLLRPAPQSEFGWLIEEVLPVNADGSLRPGDPTDDLILKTHQGYQPLPLRAEKLDPVELLFLSGMQNQIGRFNLEEFFNAVRLWRDFVALGVPEGEQHSGEWAAAVEYLLTVFDFHQAEAEVIAERYGVSSEAVTDRARELAAALQVTQFDDRYSIHPDPIAHYRELFGELGIDPRRDEEVRRQSAQAVFDTVEVPPDDDTFFGPG